MRALEILPVEVTEFMQNCRIVADRDAKNAVIVDPGGNPDKIAQLITDSGLTPKAVWLTHSHLDHAGAVPALLRKYSIPLYANPSEKIMRQKMPEIAAMYGLPTKNYPVCPEPDHEITGGEIVAIADFQFQVLFTPGHSPGHLCFYCAEMSTLLAGDLIFQGSVGRTDLPGGDPDVLLKSIKTQILPLPDDTIVYPGHGPDTTIGAERKTNPYFPKG